MPDMKKVQIWVRKIVRILPAITHYGPPSFSPFYFTLPQRMWIFPEVKHHPLGINFATR